MSYNSNQQRVDSIFSAQHYPLAGGPPGYGPPVPGAEYSPGPRFGMGIPAANHIPSLPPILMPYGVPGHLPAIPDALRPYNHLPGLHVGGNEALAFDKEAAALTHSLESLHLNPLAKEYIPPRGQPIGLFGRGQFYYGRPRFPFPAVGRGKFPYDGYHAQAGRGYQQHSGRARGEKRQQQKKKRHQRGLEDNVKRTVYISYIDQQVTEEQLAVFFLDSGKVVDCRICGDPNSAMRFAFIEFTDEEGAQKALSKTGSVLGSSPLRVLPSKTAIIPVNKELMPKSHDELERCSRTVYIANIDKKVDKNDVRHFFEQLCGKISKIRLLGDVAHSTRIAFIEFYQAEGAMAALNCSGALLGSLPLRVSPSKTPVRTESSGGMGVGSKEEDYEDLEEEEDNEEERELEEVSEGGNEANVQADVLPEN